MKWKFSLIMALVVGALAGSWIKNLPGFVIIAYDKTTYEMRLWIAVCFVLMFLSILFLIGLLVRSIMSNAGKIKGWRGGRSWRRARKQTIQGMLAFTEGRWKASEDAMVRAAKSSDTKLINYLIAAQAAQQQNAEVRRDAYLRLAHQAEPAAKVAIGLTQAQLQLKQGQYEQALASLNELRAQNPSHPHVLKLLCRLFETLQDWEQLNKLIPHLRKYRVFTVTELQGIEKICVAGMLNLQASKGTIDGVQDCWLNFSPGQRKSRINTIFYARLLVEFEQMEEAEKILKAIIKKQADAEVLALYGSVISKHPAKQLSFLENWQRAHSAAPREVFLTLGKIAFYAKLWGKTRHFLHQVLQHKPSPEAYLIMAKTLQHLGDEPGAISFYKQGLEFVANPKKRQELLSLPQDSNDRASDYRQFERTTALE